MALSTAEATITLQLANVRGTKTLTGFSEPIVGGNSLAAALSYTTGSGAGQIAVIAQAVRQLNASSAEEIDLLGTIAPFLADLVGDDATFTKVKGIIIETIPNLNTAETSGSAVRVGNATANSWQGWLSASATIDVPQGGVFLLGDPSAAGKAVDTSNRYLKIANVDTTNKTTYRLSLLGA